MSPQLRITSSTSVVGVIGDPIIHSLSPVIHNAGFESLGIDWIYVAFLVKKGHAAGALDAIRNLGLRGLSVTMPHKTEVSTLVDRVSDAARALESVNTVEVANDGQLVGHSTDGEGLIASLRENEVEVADRKVVILGAGGAARSLIDAFHRHGTRQISIVNRTLAAAQSATRLAPSTAEAISVSDQPAVAQAIRDCDIIVNATSVGMAGGNRIDVTPTSGDLPLPRDLVESRHTLVDLVYHPIETEFLRLGRELGARTVDGLGMLVHQAALQQAIWTGYRPDVANMYQAALQALS